MTDQELILELRNSKGWPNLGNAAADHIEQLVGERDEALNQLDSREHTVDVLKKRLTDRMTKLAEAIEGLRFYAEQADYEQQIIVRDCGCCSYSEDPIILDDKGNLARRVLEKLVGK